MPHAASLIALPFVLPGLCGQQVSSRNLPYHVFYDLQRSKNSPLSLRLPLRLVCITITIGINLQLWVFIALRVPLLPSKMAYSNSNQDTPSFAKPLLVKNAISMADILADPIIGTPLSITLASYVYSPFTYLAAHVVTIILGCGSATIQVWLFYFIFLLRLYCTSAEGL